MIELGIITAPRKKSTIQRSIASLRGAGFRQIVTIFAEPGSTLPQDRNITIVQNNVTLGCFKNYDNALRHLVNITNKKYIMVLQDDIVYRPDAYNILSKGLHSIPKPFGYLGIMAVMHDVNMMKKRIGNDALRTGWQRNDLGWSSWTAAGYCMDKSVVKKLIKHPVYKNHLHNFKPNAAIDACVSETLRVMDLKMYHYIPSLTQHVGETSTIKHGGLSTGRLAYRFGEHLTFK